MGQLFYVHQIAVEEKQPGEHYSNKRVMFVASEQSLSEEFPHWCQKAIDDLKAEGRPVTPWEIAQRLQQEYDLLPLFDGQRFLHFQTMRKEISYR